MKKILRKIARQATLRWRKPERHVMEKVIFPKIRHKSVLLVGVAPYTADYPKLLRENNLWTIDIDPEMEKYGSNKHVTGSIVDVENYFPKEHFDYVLLLGVFGYGLDEKEDAEKAIKAIHKILRKDGNLVIGWSDIPGRNVIEPEKLKSIKLFERVPMFGFKTSNLRKKKGVFEFLRKR